MSKQGSLCFPNLAGMGISDQIARNELAIAGIVIHELPECSRYGEVKTVIVGELFGWSFRRAWRYWVAEGPGIEVAAAQRLHESHGRVVRVDGHCGCPSPREWFHGLACGHYHVDTQDGLNALAATICRLCE